MMVLVPGEWVSADGLADDGGGGALSHRLRPLVEDLARGAAHDAGAGGRN